MKKIATDSCLFRKLRENVFAYLVGAPCGVALWMMALASEAATPVPAFSFKYDGRAIRGGESVSGTARRAPRGRPKVAHNSVFAAESELVLRVTRE